jgi:hypothetical protein
VERGMKQKHLTTSVVQRTVSRGGEGRF